MMTRLVVPSRERASWLRSQSKCTLEQVCGTSPAPELYVRDDDSQWSEYESWADALGVKLVMQDHKRALGAAQTYDSLIDSSIKEGYERLVVLDDDLVFSTQNPRIGGQPAYVKCDVDQMQALLDHFASLTCPQMPAISMTPIMKRSQGSIIAYAKPLMWTYSFYLPHFAAHPEHRFWEGKHIEARCDLNLALKILTSGFLTAFMVTCFIPDNVNNPGGCSTYRSLELENASTSYLKERWPEYVKLYPRRGWVEGPDVMRMAPRIEWREAFNAVAFEKNFGESASDFKLRALRAYERTYSKFIEEQRRGA